MWQGDLETDVPCHWHGAEEEMVSHVHKVYVSIRTEGEGDREIECLNGNVGRKKEEQQWVGGGSGGGGGGGGCKRRNKSSQSNSWQWLLQCH